MKKIIGIAVAAFIATPAMAADMAVKAPPPAPSSIMSWAGVYIGLNAGGGRAHTEWQDNHDAVCPGNGGFTAATCDIPQSSSSLIGGGQIGARWQTGQWVLGLEGTADYARFNSTILDPTALPSLTTSLTDTTKLRSLYTATAQIGIAWNRFLGYFKGGWAGSWLTRDTLFVSTGIAPPGLIVPPAGSTEGGPVSQRASGWTVGAGLEYRLGWLPNVSVGLEYDYIHLDAGNVATCLTVTGGSMSLLCGGGAGGTQPLLYNNFHADENEVLARLNYTFNWTAR